MPRIKESWGLWLISCFAVFATIKLLLQKVPGHYRVFAGAGHALYHGGNPYADDFGTHVGYYFYSPACAMTVFGPLSFLPEKLGMIVYMGVSTAVFVWGARRFWAVYRGSGQSLQWFWAGITAQLVSGILASKIEILITGLLLGAVGELIEVRPRRGWLSNGRVIAAAAGLAAVLNWKFQPLPVVGLFFLSWLLIRRDFKLPAVFAAALAGWYLLPYLFFPVDYLARIQQSWNSSFTSFLVQSVLNFENIFAFLHNSFGIPLSFAATQAIAAAAGLGIAVFLIAWYLRARPRADMPAATLIAVGLGSMFMAAFSPLGQNNALILWAPLLLVAFICRENSSRRKAWSYLIAGVCAVMTLSYSDLLPHAWSEALRHVVIKPVACLALGAAVKWELWLGASKRGQALSKVRG